MASNSGGDVGLAGLMLVLFIGLKLTGYIDWSWWWVFAPLWGSAALVLVFISIIGLIMWVRGDL